MDPPPIDLQALIDETEALEMSIPAHLEVFDETSSAQEAYALIGKILSLRPLHSQHVKDTMVNAWSFASPLAMEVLAPKKFLFAVPLQSHIDRILQQGPWNVRGSLLLLHPWTRALALNEVELFLCPFWIQVHGLPQQNMTIKNAIRIGKALGTLLDVENGENPGLICRQHLRLRVEINTTCPLIPGFFISRPNKDPLWVNFKYERLADYCTLCGLIGHKRFSCPDPPLVPPANYSIPLSAASPTYPRVIPTIQSSNSISGSTGLKRPATLPFSPHGDESTQLQLVTRLTQSIPCAPISASFQQANPVTLDEGHVAKHVVLLRISGPISTEPILATVHPSQLQAKISPTDKGKSPMYAEKSASFNDPDKAYPYPQDFDKPTQISSAPPILPTTPDKDFPLFSNPAHFLEYIAKWAIYYSHPMPYFLSLWISLPCIVMKMIVIERLSNIILFLGFLIVQSCTFQLAQSSTTNFTDQSALIAFKSKISSGTPNETVMAGNWSTTTNLCNWIGISCSRRRQRVTALNLSYMGLQGTISPHIGNLSFLFSLDFSNNSFSGSLPNEISRLRRLRILWLPSNQLEGSIPPTINYCWKLRTINLMSNHFTGTIPSSLGNMSSLVYLNLQFNSLTGPFPLVIFNISSLTAMGLLQNHISGTLPMDLCSHCPNLQQLSISDNELSGQLPSQMKYCRELVLLSLSYNKFDGSIPESFGSMENLEVLILGGNNLTGNIPLTISNLSRLSIFAIEDNNIKGSIPSDLWRLPNLSILNFEFNYLTGAIPQNLFNISSLQQISLVSNSLSGNLPSDSGFSCPRLEYLTIAINKFSGPIPSQLSNCSKLAIVDLDTNQFSGPIPTSLGHLKYLQRLILYDNQLRGEPENQELCFLSSLSNCRFLIELSISGNPLDITLPESIGNFSTTLRSLDAYQTQIKGHIPMSIGSLKSLNLLALSNNNLTGNIPYTIGRLEGLQRLYLDGNKLEGFIPEDICQLKNLGELDLSKNKISGSIPNCISNINILQKLYLSSNRLESLIPFNLWSLESLLFLDLSSNFLSGFLSPNMKKLDAIEHIDLSRNQIIGNIPSIIGAFESLSYLDLSRNSFQGDIPQSFGYLKGLDVLNLSYNNLTGVIPKSLEALSYLKYLNVSFNKLSGEIPSGGPFANFTAKSFLGNKALCGNPIFGVPPCPSPSSQGSKMKQSLLKYFLPAIASVIICLALVYMLRRQRKTKMQVPSLFNALHILEHRMISYQELCQGTNNFCESNLLGAGGFGSVYKGMLFDGTIVAIKVLNLQLSGAFKSFDAECKVLRTIRHRNLVKVISTCSNPEFRALVLEYMSNGSLERWLYSYNYCLNLLQRVNIMVDVASALDYLHHGQSESVVHCDIKPTNILLDEEMVAHVGDFGIAKILVESKDATQTKTLGTLGYIAPEYGFEGKVSIKGDVYSYGIILLEMITRKKPTDGMFVGELTLRQWISASLPNRMMEVVDDGLLRTENGRDVIVMQSVLSSIIELGLRCSEELLDERIDVKDVLAKLQKIKLTLF